MKKQKMKARTRRGHYLLGSSCWWHLVLLQSEAFFIHPVLLDSAGLHFEPCQWSNGHSVDFFHYFWFLSFFYVHNFCCFFFCCWILWWRLTLHPRSKFGIASATKLRKNKIQNGKLGRWNDTDHQFSPFSILPVTCFLLKASLERRNNQCHTTSISNNRSIQIRCFLDLIMKQDHKCLWMCLYWNSIK